MSSVGHPVIEKIGGHWDITVSRLHHPVIGNIGRQWEITVSSLFTML